jgi:hypothetical protein
VKCFVYSVLLKHFVLLSSEVRSRKPRLRPQGIRRTDHATPLYQPELALTSLTSGGRSVGIVRSGTKATELASAVVVVVVVSAVVVVVVVVVSAVVVVVFRLALPAGVTCAPHAVKQCVAMQSVESSIHKRRSSSLPFCFPQSAHRKRKKKNFKGKEVILGENPGKL